LRIIDTHLHLVDRTRFRYPWLDGVPALNRDWSLDAYRAQAQAAGIEAAIHMEVDVADADREGETAWATALSAPVIAAIASCRPEDADFPKKLDALAGNPRLRGLRRILHTSPDELGQHPLFAENLRRLPAYGLTFDLCVLARQLPVALMLAKACPQTQFVLDHCGVPDVAGKALDPWRADIAALAALPNVACKISGVVAYAGDGWMTGDLKPFVEHCIAAFGWDRVVWGSDWPVCTLTADLKRWVTATHDLLSGASEDEKTKLLSRNAGRIYRLAGIA
jgi:predicted TIM-barrel fold metal-dependent hydrolase